MAYTIPTESDLQHIICPDGDMHVAAPINHIYASPERGVFLLHKWRVYVEYANGDEYVWEAKNERSAREIRDRLIAAYRKAGALREPTQS